MVRPSSSDQRVSKRLKVDFGPPSQPKAPPAAQTLHLLRLCGGGGAEEGRGVSGTMGISRCGRVHRDGGAQGGILGQPLVQCRPTSLAEGTASLTHHLA